MDLHTEWDSPHEFAVLTWDNEMDVLGVTAITLIDTAIHPEQYPALMVDQAAAAIRDHVTRRRLDASQIVGVMLTIEAYAVAPPKNMTPEEEKILARDRRERRFATRDDAVEMAQVMLVDVNGRFASVVKRRDSSEIEEVMAYDIWNPVQDAPPAYSGAFVSALKRITLGMRTVLYGRVN
jgi:hypothetical protein